MIIAATDSAGAVGFSEARIVVEDENEPPRFPKQTRFIVENSLTGKNVGEPLSFSDDDKDNVLLHIDGGNGANTPNVLETFELYGCFVTNADYGSLAYANNEPMAITLEIQYDNAIQSPQGTGIGTALGRTVNTLITGGGV